MAVTCHVVTMSSHTHIIAPKTITPDLETFAQCLERYDKSEQELPDKAKSAKLAFQSHFPALCTLVDRHATQNKEHGKVYDKMKQHIICMTVILTMLRQKHNDLMVRVVLFLPTLYSTSNCVLTLVMVVGVVCRHW